MVVIDTEQTRRALSFDAAIPALREAFRQGAHVPTRHVHAIESGGAHGTTLIMPAWNEQGYFGVKVINIFPENTRQSLPGYLLRIERSPDKHTEWLAFRPVPFAARG